MTRFLLSLALAGALFLPAGAFARDGDYLFDLVKKPAYKRAWAAMVAGARGPKWVTRFHVHRNAVAFPATSITIGQQLYEVAGICKPHDCGDNQFRVLFLPGGARAWGVLQVAGRAPRFFGSPSPQQRKALVAALAS